jgi:hypothetical protein
MRKAQCPFECVAESTGGRNVAWQPSGSRLQSSGDAVSAAALTGPRATAQTGVPLQPLVRELCVSWQPRRQRLGGVRHGRPVDDGGVGLRPAPPTDPAVSALCRLGRCLRHDLGSLGHRSGARHSRRRGLLCAAAWADHGGDDRAGAGACSNKLSTRAGENSPPLQANCCCAWGVGILPAEGAASSARRVRMASHPWCDASSGTARGRRAGRRRRISEESGGVHAVHAVHAV